MQTGTPVRSASAALMIAAAYACVLAALLLAVLAPLAQAAPVFPELTGRIVDNAGLLTAEDRAAIEQELASIEVKSTDQVVVVTVPTLQGYEIEDYGYQLGRKWGIGQKGKDNGVLLLIAPNERKVRIEAGRGLEAHLTDAMSRIIIENAILPKFRRGDVSGGIRDGVRDIKATIEGDAEGVKERARSRVGEHSEVDWISLLVFALWVAIFAYIMYAQYQQAKRYPQTAGRNMRRSNRRGRDGGMIIVPGGSGDWGGGWSGGGGGGWSGGGGDFGGGGASGSW